MGDLLRNVAIIGAGLGGCALALAFTVHDISVTLYESRPVDSDVLRSGVVLTPNGLWVLDRLGVFDRIKDRCFKATHRVFKNDKDETTKKTLVADESLYGYRNHRIWRKLLLDEMKQMLVEKSVQINYDSKYNGIVSDRSDGVTFRINQSEHKASLLIGSDGIYSTVQKHIAPDVVLEYTGTTAVLAHIKRESVAWPYEDYEWNATIQGKPNAIFFLPEDPKGEDIMIGMQTHYPEQSRGDLERLQADHERLFEFYKKGYDEHGATAKKIIDRIGENKDTLYIWPFMKMPKLERWYSETGRVIIVADAAHQAPASSGQGVNQALEDAYSLTLLLTSVAKRANGSQGTPTSGQDAHAIKEALAFWQNLRQTRMDAIFEWVEWQNLSRLPEEDRNRLLAEGKGKSDIGDDMSWLYRPTLESDISKWLESRS